MPSALDAGLKPARSADHSDALKWFVKAADKGTSWGQFHLGVSYARGQGVPQDYGQARAWFLKAANQGEPMSQYSLGQLEEKGLGLAADPIEAYKWFHLAAGHGIAAAEKARELVARSLTSEQVAEAQRRADAFAATRGVASSPARP